MITQALCQSFMNELPLGLHNFTTGTNVFKLALFTSAANLNATTTIYDGVGEVPNGSGYVTGGATLTSVTPVLDSGVVVFDFNDPTWAAASFTTRGALVYNSSVGNRAIMVLDFGSDRTVTNGTFTVRMPDPSASDAIIRIS